MMQLLFCFVDDLLIHGFRVPEKVAVTHANKESISLQT